MKHFLQHLADRLATKWNKQYVLTLHWIRPSYHLLYFEPAINALRAQELNGEDWEQTMDLVLNHRSFT